MLPAAGGGGLYDVRPDDLVTGSGNLAADAAETGTHTGTATSAASSAAGACGEGGFAAALAAFAAAGRSVGDATAAVLSDNGTTLSSNAQRYLGDDAAATGLLGTAGAAFDAPAAAAPAFTG